MLIFLVQNIRANHNLLVFNSLNFNTVVISYLESSMYRLLCALILNFLCFINLIAENEQIPPSILSLIHDREVLDEELLNQELDCNKHHDKHKEIPTKIPNIDLFEFTLSAECEPLTTVAGCVNIASGSFFQVDRDLKGTTIDPLDFVRYYDSGSNGESFLGFGFGSGFPLWATGLEKGAKHNYGLISERDNFLLLYRGKEQSSSRDCRVDPRILKKGYTNLCRAKISAKTNFVNWRAIFRSQKDFKGWMVRLGDGTRRFYNKHVKVNCGLRTKMNFPTEDAYLLKKEIKPNGNQLIYEYDSNPEKPRLKSIQTRNRIGSTVINQLFFDYEREYCTVQDSIGHSVTFNKIEALRLRLLPLGTRFIQKKFLESVVSTQKKGSFNYTLKDLTWGMARIQKPGKQFLVIDYDCYGKVTALYGPQDTQNEISLYRFKYYKQLTEVTDAIGQLTAYVFDDHQRVSEIIYVDQNRHRVRKDFFEWSRHEDEAGWLKSKSIGVGDRLHYLKTYTYDKKGNVKKETLYGNLTGKKEESFKRGDEKKMDDSSITYHYSQDEFNLLTQKSTDEGLTISYAYLEGTNLCVKMLYHYEGKIQERIFRHYDDNGEVHTLIEDDGSSEEENNLHDVTFRKIKYIESVKKKGPSFGKPEVIVEFCRHKYSGESIFLRKTTFFYDEQGCEKKQVITDSQGKEYISFKEYDCYLHLIKESNALGETTEYAYDDNENKISEELLGSDKRTVYTYDFANRLVEKKEIHAKIGHDFITSYRYDACNQLVSETDPYGQTTIYQYDRLGNQICCKKTAIQDGYGGVFHPSISKKYNLLNQAISIINENHAETQYTYNVYGQPTKIIYPDGAKEEFVYYPCGWLKEKIQADETSITYKYDGKGQLVKKTWVDAEGNEIKTEKYVYKGSLLLAKKDAMGLETTYEYDSVGRKIKESTGHLKTIDYRYDDFDRVIEKKENVRVETTVYDALDRPIEKQMRENNILISQEKYRYDIHGQLKRTDVIQSADQTAIYKSYTNSDETLEWKEDPLGYRTLYTYDHRSPYILGHFVKTKTITDPLGRSMIEIYDPFDRLSRKDVFDKGQCASCTEWSYDATGNCTKEQSLVMAYGQAIREYWVEKSYTKRGLLRKEREMPQEKTTVFQYDAMQRLKKKIKPDGVQINYTYDSLSRLKTLQSSDGGLDYTYHYDLHDNITQVEDRVQKITQHRLFDLYSRLSKEAISPGVVISYDYDVLDRLTKLTLPDGSAISYIYGANLNTIQRLDPNGTIRYTIACPSYDLRGNLLEIRSPAGLINYTYDLLCRMVKIDSPHWGCDLEEFDAIGNLCRMKQRDPDGIISGQYNYDRLNHLTCELSHERNQYAYDSLGNCLIKNDKERQINPLNQLTNDGEAEYAYDFNGNLKQASAPQIYYAYDALNRLISCEKEGKRTTFVYDTFGRCLQITDESGTKNLLYQNEQEIGSWRDEQLQELRLVHPNDRYDLTFATEMNDQIFFPIQDSRNNICALQRADGSLAEWTRYSAFGSKIMNSDLQGIYNPWRFANRREVVDLSLFMHRFYNSQLMRWQTTDPLGFGDGLNLYGYVHNNPFCYKDPDGRFAFAIPVTITLMEWSFGAAAVATSPAWLPAFGATIAVSLLSYGCYELCSYASNQINTVNETQEQVRDTPKPSQEDIKKKHSPNQQALSDLVKQSGKKGVTNTDANTLLEWANEYEFPARDDRYVTPSHWVGGDHIHIGPKHVPVTN